MKNNFALKTAIEILVLMVFAGVLIYFTISYNRNNKALNNSQVSQQSFEKFKDNPLNGGILLTLSEIENNPKNLSYSRIIKLGTNEKILYSNLNDLKNADRKIAYSHSVSFNGKYGVFLSADKQGAMLVYKAVITDFSNGQDFQKSMLSAERVGGATTKYKAKPSINNVGAILYTSLGDTSKLEQSENSVEDFNIHLINSDGKDIVLGKGFAAKWLNDESYLVLRQDGLYLNKLNEDYTLGKKIIVFTDRIGKQRNQLFTNIGFDISRQGQVLVSDPENSSLFLYSLNSNTDTASYILKDTVKTAGFFPTFSQNGGFFAVLHPENDNASGPQTKVQVFEILQNKVGSMKMIKNNFEYNLQGFDQKNMSIDEWI